MMEGEGRGKRLAATACAFTLLFCLAVGLGVHGAFQYQQVKQEQRLSAEYSLKQAQKAAAQPPSRRETEKSTATPEAKPPTATQESETEQESVLPISTTSAVTTADGALSEPAARREPSRIPAGLQNDHKVYLTFDDGPSQNTLEILRILKEHNAKATFFVVNSKYNAYMKRIVKSGNAIALHTFTHSYKTIYQSEAAYFEDLQKISDVVKRETGVEAKVIRFPGGSSNTVSRRYRKGIMSRLTKQVEEKGYTYFDWNCSSGDANGNGIPAAKLLRNIRAETKHMNGHIVVLMHDSQAKTTTVEALPDILTYFESRGFTFEVLTPETPVVHHGVNN